MTISLYKTSVPIFVQFLTSLSAVLDKAAAFAEAKKVDPSVLLTSGSRPTCFRWRGRCGPRPTTRSMPADGWRASNCRRSRTTTTSIPELKERIAKTIEFIKGLKPSQIDGNEDKEIKIVFPSGTREFTGQSLLLNNSLPNFYFHCTTAYDILRHSGVELGKRDFMGTPVSL